MQWEQLNYTKVCTAMNLTINTRLSKMNETFILTGGVSTKVSTWYIAVGELRSDFYMWSRHSRQLHHVTNVRQVQRQYLTITRSRLRKGVKSITSLLETKKSYWHWCPGWGEDIVTTFFYEMAALISWGTYLSQLLRVDPSALASSPPAIGWRPASRGGPGATHDGCDLYTFI